MRRRLLSIALVMWAGSGFASNQPFALQNERLFFLDFKRGEISGKYNPAGYSFEEVEKVLEWICSRGRLGEISELRLENGLKAVEVDCRLSDITGYGRAEIRKRHQGQRFDIRYRGTTNHGRIFRKRTF